MIRIDGYEILNPIGAGGMGEVYLANQLATSRQVALKVLLPQYVSDADFTERFLHEGKITDSLNHPHIVNIYDFGESDGIPYLALEYLPSGDLNSMLKGQGNLSMVLRAIHQVAGALVYSHGMGVVHGDVKPQNILFQDVGRAVLTDFGAAQNGDLLHSADQSDYALGSPLYISPEQVRGEPASPLSDIYSLGVILYEALSGHPPYLGESSEETAKLHLAAESPPLLPDEYSEYQGFINGMMAREPKNRFVELSDFINDFHAALQGNQYQTGEEPLQIDQTQRIQMEEHVEQRESDYFFIAPKSSSEIQNRTQRIPVQGGDHEHDELDEYEIPPTMQNQPATVRQPAVSAVLNDKAPRNVQDEPREPVKEWVTSEQMDQLEEMGDGKLDDLLYFLQDVKENLRENGKNRALKYPQIEEVGRLLKPVKKEVERQSFIYAEKLSQQTKLWFMIGIILLCTGGILGLVMSRDEAAPSSIDILPSLPVDSTVQSVDSNEIASSEDYPGDPVYDTALTKTTTGRESESAQKPESEPVSVKAGAISVSATPHQTERKFALITETGNDRKPEKADPVKLAMRDEQPLAKSTTSPVAPVTRKEEPVQETNPETIEKPVDQHNIIDKELEVALGRHVGWMVRHEDGSLSLFVDWVDLVNKSGSDNFSKKAKKSLNVMAYVIRNYKGFSISISDHSHKTKTVSASRAHMVLNYLRDQGVPAVRMQTASVESEINGNVEMHLIPNN